MNVWLINMKAVIYLKAFSFVLLSVVTQFYTPKGIDYNLVIQGPTSFRRASFSIKNISYIIKM